MASWFCVLIMGIVEIIAAADIKYHEYEVRLNTVTAVKIAQDRAIQEYLDKHPEIQFHHRNHDLEDAEKAVNELMKKRTRNWGL